jgi:regulator of sigma E protease
MDFWIKAAQLFLSLAILVTLHELGHFIPARLFKTRIEKFYLFFNPWFSLFRYKKVNGVKKTAWFKKESPKDWKQDESTTEWGIGWLPLGGYVKIAGMIDESMDKEQLAKPAEQWEFRSKKTWQRLIIMVGGVTVNLLLGFLIYILVIFTWGQTIVNPTKLTNGLAVHPYLAKYHLVSGDKVISIENEPLTNLDELNKGILLRDKRNLVVQHVNGKVEKIQLPENIDTELFQAGAFPPFGLRSKSNIVESVVKKSPAEKAGLKNSDEILSVNGHEIIFFDDFQSSLYKEKGKSAILLVKRSNDTLEIKTAIKEDGTIGFQSNAKTVIDSLAITTEKYSFLKSISVGFTFGSNTLSDYISQFKFVFTKKGATSIGGFAAIGNMFPATWNWQIFWLNTALLSIILAFMNILPIPALDGGHVVFLLYEMITGKEAPQKVLEIAQYIGIVLLLGLMVYANGNDLVKWLFP